MLDKITTFILSVILSVLLCIVTGLTLLINPNQANAASTRAILSQKAATTYLQDSEGYSPKFIENATYEGSAIEYADIMTDLVDGCFPEQIDDILMSRGWTITFTDKDPNDILPFRSIWGVTNWLTKDITVTVNNGTPIVVDTADRITNTVMHEVGHAIDYECGRISKRREFVETISSTRRENTPLNDFKIELDQAGDPLSEKFAAAFAYYAQYPEYDDSCPDFYDWISKTILPPLKYEKDWSLKNVEWREEPSSKSISELVEKFGQGNDMARNVLSDGVVALQQTKILTDMQCYDLFDSITKWEHGKEVLARRGTDA